MEFRPRTPYESLTLTVAGPHGEIFSETFPAGQAASFALTGRDASRRLDGSYTFEVRLAPVLEPGTRERLAALRESNPDELEAELRRENMPPSRSLVYSGTFRIANGSLFLPGLSEPPAPRQRPSASSASAASPQKVLDQVIADDLIVQGSACVGLDCVNNEVFGFDTIRLKENNNRIQFDDTSTAAGFATNNWQIRANSSASGGASFLGFVDQGDTGNSETGTIVFEVDAGAPANSLKVSSTGKVGLRTATPALDLHLATSDTPAIRLEQGNTGGFTPQTWDIAGNEANFFVRDVTGGSRLPFRIRPGAPTSSIDIAASGFVGIGTASPSGPLHIGGAATADVFAGMGPDLVSGPAFNFGYAGNSFGRSAGFFNVRPDASAAAPNPSLRFATANVERMIVTNVGSVGIGTSGPVSKLHVKNGDIRVENGSFIDDGVTVIAPDYVFDAGYSLMPLDDLASFIKDHSHLPNVPEAAEIKKNGLNLSRFQMKLLEKIEELALYALQQQKSIRDLAASKAALEARIESLEKRLEAVRTE